MIDPLHQFVIKPLIPLKIAGYDISFTNSSLFITLTTGLLIIYMARATAAKALIPSRLQASAELLHDFIHDMVENNAGPTAKAFVPYIFSLFLFILMGNLLGLIPYSFTFTSHIIVTMTLALIIFVIITLVGIFKHGLHFLRLFFPSDIPIFVAPLLIPVEIMSYLSRPLSLGVRLFANMVAGHAMLKIFAGFAVLLSTGTLLPLSILPLMVNVLLTGFEVMVAILQAYVFTILTCIYLNDALNLH